MDKLMIHIVSLAFALVFNISFPLYAQENENRIGKYSIDSLKSIARGYPVEKDLIVSEAKTRQIFNNIYKGDSLEYLYSLSYACALNRNFVQAIKYSLQARNHFLSTDNKDIEAELIILTGNSYQRLSYYKKAIFYYRKALDFPEKHLNIKRKNRLLIDIGNAYIGQENNDSAKHYYQLAFHNSKESADSLNLFASLVNMGNLYMETLDFNKAEEYTRQALELGTAIDEEFSIICKFNLGLINFRKKAYLQAREYFQEVLNRISGSRYESLWPEVYKYRAIMDYETGNFEFAIQNCTMFLSVKNKYQVSEYLFKSVNTLNPILVDLFERPHARELLLQMNGIVDSLIRVDYESKKMLEESFEELSFLEKNFKILEQENMLNKEKLYNSRLFFLFTFIVLILTGIALISIVRAKNKIRKQNEIISNQLSDITRKNIETSELNSKIKSQSEKISLQNAHLTKYQNHLEQLIEERTNALSEALVRAQESDKLKTSFLQNISHEIRTPLNAISGFSQLLTADNHEKKQYIDYINQNVFDLIDMVENIMIFSKIYSNQVNIKRKNFHLKNLVKEICTDVVDISNKYKEKQIEFSIEDELGEEFKIATDYSLLKKILLQLIDNSYKFTEQGKIKITFTHDNDMLACRVEDSGIGINQDQIPYIFETFRKIEGEHKLFRGTGIGLSIVKSLTEMLGGTIQVESEFGKGTSMTVNVPLK